MKQSIVRTDSAAGCRAALAVVLFCGGLQAANLLTATPSAVALSCSTATGPGPAATVVIKPLATLTTNALTVSLGAVGGGVVVTPPTATVLNAANQAKGLTYTFNLAAGCAGATSGATTVRFSVGAVADVTVTVTRTVTAKESLLAAAPVTLTCVRNAGPPVAYTPGPAQTVSVTSAAPGGTPFTVDASTLPAWLAVTPATGGSAGATGVPLTVSAVSPCGSFLVGSSNSTSIHLRNQPAPDALIPVTLRVLGPSPVAAVPATASLSYTKGSDTPAFVDIALSAAGATPPNFTVDTASLPPWLAVDIVTGVLPKTLRFTTTKVADSIAQGAYSATVRVPVSGFSDLSLSINLAVSNPAPKLTVAEGIARDISWTIGQPLPTPYITLASSGSAIPYTIATGGPLAPAIGASYLKGFAYSYGASIPVTLDPSAFAAAEPGSVLTGTVTVTWGSPATKTVITFTVAVQSAGASVLAVSPRNLPTSIPGQSFTVALIGSGFVSGADPASRTVVGIVSAGALVVNANIASSVINASNIILTITVPATADPLLPFAPTGAGGTVTLGVCNPAGAGCRTPTSTATLSIGSIPVIQAVTSASSYVQVAPPTLPAVAPYDMISLFGINFCTAGGTGCGDDVLYAAPDPAALRFPTTLSPDKAGVGRRLLSATFQTHANPPAPLGDAPLLFATDGQINLLVPSGVAAFIGKSVDIVVNFGASGAVGRSSAPFTVNVVAANPGIFTVGGDGQGEGAILGQDWGMITRGNEAGMRQNAADSDVVQIYATGLGAPDGAADNAVAGGGLWPADCVSLASYLISLSPLTTGVLTNVDGALISSSLFNTGRLGPCLRAATVIPTVTIGGQPATVTYAGWAPDAVAGQYQVNVRLPGSGSLTGPSQLPVTIAARGRTSQPGVTMWVAPRLKVTGPAALRGTAGALWPTTGNLVTASGGTGPYQYAVSAGALPAGLVLNAASGAISGTPAADAAGTYAVTVTATDSAAKPLTGSAVLSLTVGAAPLPRP